jgi:hypothetical protein
MFVRDVNIQPKRNGFRLASLESIFYVQGPDPGSGPVIEGVSLVDDLR